MRVDAFSKIMPRILPGRLGVGCPAARAGLDGGVRAVELAGDLDARAAHQIVRMREAVTGQFVALVGQRRQQ